MIQSGLRILTGITRYASTPWRIGLQGLLASTIAATAWGSPDLSFLWLLALIPLLILATPSRLITFCVAFTYYGTSVRAIPGIVDRFFGAGNPLYGIAVWSAFCIIMSATWTTLRPARYASPRGFAASLSIFLLSSIPPIGLLHMGSPLLVSAMFFPGAGFAGIIGTALLLSLVPWAARATLSQLCHRPCSAVDRGVQAAAVVLLALAAITNIRFEPSLPPSDWVAHSTSLGKPASPTEIGRRIKERKQLIEMAKKSIDGGARVVAFPEGVSGEDRPVTYGAWSDAIELAKRSGATILLGMETNTDAEGNFDNTIKAIGSEDRIVATSRIPMPIGMWRFGLFPGARKNALGSDLATVAGLPIAVSICYEDMILWPHPALLLPYLYDKRPVAHLSIANQWSTAGTSGESFQDTHRSALSRLSGIPLLVAKNR